MHARQHLTSCGFFLNLFAAALDVLSEALHRVATCDRAQHAQQHQCRKASLQHGVSPLVRESRLQHKRPGTAAKSETHPSYCRPMSDGASRPAVPRLGLVDAAGLRVSRKLAIAPMPKRCNQPSTKRTMSVTYGTANRAPVLRTAAVIHAGGSRRDLGARDLSLP